MKHTTITSYNDLHKFCVFAERETRLFEVDLLGFPWYSVAIETMHNAMTPAIPQKICTDHKQDRQRDYDTKKQLLNQKYDYVFIAKSRLRRGSPQQAKNILFNDIYSFVGQSNRFIIFDMPSGDNNDLKYLDDSLAPITIPYECIIEQHKPSVTSDVLYYKKIYQSKINELFADANIPPEFENNATQLKQAYNNLTFQIPHLLIMQKLFGSMEPKALFGAMSTHLMAGLNNSYAIVEIGHGLYGSYRHSHYPQPQLWHYQKKHFKLNQLMVLMPSVSGKICYEGTPACFRQNLFNYGLPDLRFHQPSPEKLDTLKARHTIKNEPIILIASHGAINHLDLEDVIRKIQSRYPYIKIAIKPHPAYDDPTQTIYNIDGVLNVADENIYDLLSLANVVMSAAPSSVIEEAALFTSNIIAFPKTSYSSPDDINIINKKYPFADVIPLCQAEELIDKLGVFLTQKNISTSPQHRVDVNTELSTLFSKVDQINSQHTINSNEAEKKPFCLAIFTPNIGTLSETFIQKQIQLLAPDNTVVIANTIFDDSWFQGPLLKIPFSQKPGAVYTKDNEKKVCNFLKTHNVTHILCEYGCYGTEIVKLNREKLNLPIFVHFHGGDASTKIRESDWKKYYRWMGQQVNGIIAVAIPMAERLKQTGIPSEKIKIIHYGIEIPERTFSKPENNPCKFISVMRLVPKKGPLYLLKAFAKARESCPEITLDIIGNGFLKSNTGQLHQEVIRFIKDNNLNTSVILHGAQNNSYVKKALNSASVFVQHSITDPETGDAEGLPNTILEAAAAGLPVISTRHEGIPEEVDHEKTGFLVDEKDTEGMAHYMIHLATHPSVRKEMGTKARKKIIREFDVNNTIAQLREYIQPPGKETESSCQHNNKLIEKGEALYKSNDLSGAIKCFEEVLKSDTGNIVAHNNLGVAYWSRGDSNNALAHLKQANNLDPYDKSTIINLSKIYSTQNKHESTVNSCRPYLEKHPHDKEILTIHDISTKQTLQQNTINSSTTPTATPGIQVLDKNKIKSPPVSDVLPQGNIKKPENISFFPKQIPNNTYQENAHTKQKEYVQSHFYKIDVKCDGADLLRINSPNTIPLLRQIHSETSLAERMYLYNFFAKIWDGLGDVCEIGPYLGGTTRAIALGMQDNVKRSKYSRLHTYDKFSGYLTQDALHKLANAGALQMSDISAANISNWMDTFNKIHSNTSYAHLLVTKQMELPSTIFEVSSIDNLFHVKPPLNFTAVLVDGCKSWYATKYFMREIASCTQNGAFFHFQDYGHWTCFWIPVFLYIMRDYFRLVACVDTTYSFQLIRNITPQIIDQAFPDIPHLLERKFFDDLFEELLKEAEKRHDFFASLFHSLQHAISLAYLGFEGDSQDMIRRLASDDHGEAYNTIIQKALHCPVGDIRKMRSQAEAQLYEQRISQPCIASEKKPAMTWDMAKQFSPLKLYAGSLPSNKEYNQFIGISNIRCDHKHICHDITNPFPLPDNSVDIFQSEDVFEHIEYDKLLPIINEIYRILKPNGLFRLSVPDYGCDILTARSTKDRHGNIISDPGGKTSPEDPGHIWFPKIDNVKALINKSAFAQNGKIDYLHYYNLDGSFVVKKIDYSKGLVRRTPDFDSRVQNPYRPMSIIVDMTKKEPQHIPSITTSTNKNSTKPYPSYERICHIHIREADTSPATCPVKTRYRYFGDHTI